MNGIVATTEPRVSVRTRIWVETVAARAAFAVIALHVIDDNFIQPEPGTAATGHLVSALVPLALIAAAAACYPRLRPGFRAALAFLFGVLGVLAGTEAAYYTANGGASGDDYTGYLSVAAGLLLLAVGSAALWSSRRRNDGRLWRYTRRFLLTVAAALVAMFVVFPISLAYVVTHTARAKAPRADLGAAYENVEFTTSDGLLLKGWYILSKNRAAVIAFPGRSRPQNQARMLARHGYGVLVFDRRGEGESEGDPNVFGWGGERDLDAAAAYLRSRRDVDSSRIGGIGLSVGGEMLIHAAAHSDAFKAIVSEGASGQSLRDELANPRLSERLLDLPLQVSLTTAVTVFTNKLPPPSLKSEVAKIAPTPVFFIYGEHGQGGTETGPNKAFYAVARGTKQIWQVPNGQHIDGITTQPAEYERRVIAFFDSALLGAK
jgi:dienelactone hydrolase